MTILFVDSASPGIQSDVIAVLCEPLASHPCPAVSEKNADGIDHSPNSCHVQTGTVSCLTDMRRFSTSFILMYASPAMHEPFATTDQMADIYHSIFKKTLELGCRSVTVPIMVRDNASDEQVDSALTTAVKCADAFLESIEGKEHALDIIINLDNWRLSRRRFETAVRTCNRISSFNEVHSGMNLSFESLEKRLEDLSPTFYETLLNLVEEKGMTQVECYKKANLDRRFFSRLKNRDSYNPTRNKVLEIAVAMNLTMTQTRKLLRSAGYELTSNRVSDVIIAWHISHGIYDPEIINCALSEYGQPLLNI